MNIYLFHPEHIPERAAFPAVDAHNHLWGADAAPAKVAAVMDAVGVAVYADLTANVAITWSGGGYQLAARDLEVFFRDYVAAYPGRFYGFTCATFAHPADRPLFDDAGSFAERTVALLREHVRRGARGLKVLKELGLRYRDGQGRLIAVDDPRLAPIWDEAGRLGVPVLIHQADPYGFFEPVTPDNEHYDTLLKFPDWSFADPRFPRFQELIERRDRLVARHPRTTFILPHGANFPENLGYLARLLDTCPNVHLDFSARLDELGRQPFSARDFFLRYQDRILFGTDMPASPEVYRNYFRFLETRDEYFPYPDYDGTYNRRRWCIYGLYLPAAVLRRIYQGNALRLIPGLAQDLAGS